ncbi:helix-turn-helix domain-containing protein [Kordia jejudonensis]|uniref:helix-turn-helix domain-containing protein n=1 Tax=Kordia jejudonensis TaxID=1348245 RepID=UPI0012E088F1|nr:AraC family transcriptional regulator [Kordia jejudonensis]
MMSPELHAYTEVYPSKLLEDFVGMYWRSENLSNEAYKITICPDGYFKLIIQVIEGKIISYFMTGLWLNEIEVVIQPKMITYGIKFKIIAPEYIFKREIKSILNSVEQLPLSYFEIDQLDFSNFPKLVTQFEALLFEKIPPKEDMRSNRLRLSQFLYTKYSDIQASEVANQIYWSQREINRYLNKYLGISLKKYLNIQKCYRAYLQIREGKFFPEKGFFDQAHFIREVKKHTGQTPRNLFKKQNDQFIQLKNIKKL